MLFIIFHIKILYNHHFYIFFFCLFIKFNNSFILIIFYEIPSLFHLFLSGVCLNKILLKIAFLFLYQIYYKLHLTLIRGII